MVFFLFWLKSSELCSFYAQSSVIFWFQKIPYIRFCVFVYRHVRSMTWGLERGGTCSEGVLVAVHVRIGIDRCIDFFDG